MKKTLLLSALASISNTGIGARMLAESVGKALKGEKPRVVTKEDLDRKEAAEQKRLSKNAKRLKATKGG